MARKYSLTRRARNRKRKVKLSRRVERTRAEQSGGDNNIDNTVLLIPMHPKHYTLVYRLLNKLRDNKIHIDIYGIFSDTDDYGAFDMKSRIKHIIPEGVPSDDSAVEYKRLYGLKQMMNTKYENIISAVSR